MRKLPSAKAQFHSELRKDIMISVVINVALTLLAEILIFHGHASIPLYGVHGIAFDFLPSSYIPAMLMTLLLSIAVGKRARSGHYKRDVVQKPFAPFRILARLVLPLRALAMALATTILLPIVPLGGLVLLGIQTMGFDELLAMKAVYAGVMAVLLTPLIVKMALVRREELV